MEPAQTLHSHVALGYMIHRHRLNCLISSSGENRRGEEGRVKNFVANLVRSTNESGSNISFARRGKERKRRTSVCSRFFYYLPKGFSILVFNQPIRTYLYRV